MASMFSPPRREKARDDAHLPEGDCRYILLHPAVKNQRCACVGFALNRSTPGSTCDCGHQACYHVPDKESNSAEQQELQLLKDKISMLESRLDQERHIGRAEVVERLGRLEESFDKSQAELETHTKNVYKGIGGLWQNVGTLQRKTIHYEDEIEGLVDDVQRFRSSLIEVDDASMKLEDRVESLERASFPAMTMQSRRRKASTPPGDLVDDDVDTAVKSEEISSKWYSSKLPLHITVTEEPLHIQHFRERVASVGSGSQAWTVHVSLMPTSAQPFPFEKDTAAYKRCLSRGLHRVIAIPDTDSESFITAISDAFVEILRGRKWVPLVAKLCDAKTLCGLPMLRQLEPWLVGCDFNWRFLQEHCAVTDNSGKILDLYIAMSNDTISWAELKEVTPSLRGLEAAWMFDNFLDGPSRDNDIEGIVSDSLRIAAGDIVPTWSPTSTRPKRKESDITRTGSFGSSTESEISRAKLRRTRQFTTTSVESVERRVEAV